MKEKIIELKARVYCNEKNEKQPVEYKVIEQGKIVCNTFDLVSAMSAFLNRING